MMPGKPNDPEREFQDTPCAMTGTSQPERVLKTALGLDLAGYSTDGSALARADRLDSGTLRITVFRNQCFGRKVAGKRVLSNVIKAESALLAACLRHHRLVVDVPIDLQDLPTPRKPHFVWELTKRPVDYAFNAMPPLAQRIGSYVARFLHLRRSLPAELKNALAATLFETYPAASLKLMSLPNKKYKGAASCGEDGTWQGRPDKIPAQSKMNHQLAGILNGLGWTAPASEVLSHDEFDAILCAVCGVAEKSELLEGAALKEHIEQAIRAKCSTKSKGVKSGVIQYSPPQGYRLLSKRPPMGTIAFMQAKDDEGILNAIVPTQMD